MNNLDNIQLETVNGSIKASEVSMVLAHEHMFADFNPVDAPDYMNVNWSNKIGAAVENVNVLKAQGVNLIVDWTCIGVGRNATALRAVGQQSEVNFICPTGIYKDYIPPAMGRFSAEELAARFLGELDHGIDDTNIRAGFIKTSVTESGLRKSEEIVLAAAAMASVQSDASIGIHGPVHNSVNSAIKVMQREGFNPAKLICAHGQVSSLADNQKLADMGVTLQYDAIGAYRDQFFDGPTSDSEMLDRLCAMIEYGHEDNILMSTDASVCINPASAQYDRNNAYLYRYFESKMVDRLGAQLTRKILRDNAIKAFSRLPAGSIASNQAVNELSRTSNMKTPSMETNSDMVWNVSRKYGSTNN